MASAAAIAASICKRRSKLTAVVARRSQSSCSSRQCPYENIGRGGLFVATSRPERVADRISPIFRLPTGGLPIVAEGEVCWVRTSPLPDARHGALGMGIRFTKLSLSVVAATIQEFLRRSVCFDGRRIAK